MTQTEKILVSRLLDDLSIELAQNGCNDTPKEFLNLIPKEEREELTKKVNEWNGSEKDGYLPFKHIPDFLWAGYFSAKVLEEKCHTNPNPLTS